MKTALLAVLVAATAGCGGLVTRRACKAAVDDAYKIGSMSGSIECQLKRVQADFACVEALMDAHYGSRSQYEIVPGTVTIRNDFKLQFETPRRPTWPNQKQKK